MMQSTESFQPLSAKIRKSILFLFTVIIFLCVMFFAYSYFVISKIEVIGIKDIKGVEGITGKIIFSISDKGLEDKLYSQNPDIESISIIKKLPNTIQVQVTKNTDLVALVVADGFFVLNKKARIVSKTRENIITYPKINYYQKLLFNQYAIGKYLKISPIQNALFFYGKLKDMGIYPDIIEIVDQDTISYLAIDKTYIFSIERNNDKQCEELKIILKRFSIEKTNYKKIDLRFEKPIIGIE